MTAYLHPVARPQRARFQRRDQVVGEAGLAGERLRQTDARQAAPEKTALGRDQRRAHLVAEALAQCRAQVAEPVGKAKLDRVLRAPKLAGEQRLVGALEARAAPLLDQRDEALVDVLLDGLEAFDVLRLLGLERVEHHLALARAVDAPLDAEPVHQLGEAEGTAD